MNKSSKLYKKAILKMENGEINKALIIARQSFKCNNRNNASLNLIGLIYYFKGDLPNAQRFWNTSRKCNGDKISIKYLQDSKNDAKNLSLYKEGVSLYNQFKIDKALEIFKDCEKSHFNFINLNNYISMCYIKKAKYNDAVIYIDKVLEMDKKNKLALSNRRIVEKYGDISKRYNKKLIVSIALGLTFLIICSSLIYFNKSNFNKLSINFNKDFNLKHKKISNKKPSKNKIVNEKTNKKTSKNLKINKKQSFNINKVNEAINKKDFNLIYSYIYNVNRENLDVNEKLIYDKANSLLKNEGIKYFYKLASNQLKENKLNEAKDNLIKAKKFSENTYLDEHIIYFLGYIYQKQENAKDAIKYYTEYYNKFKDGSYNEIVLYDLSILNDYSNKKIAKQYANKLVNKYPNSIYNNNKIKNIINN